MSIKNNIAFLLLAFFLIGINMKSTFAQDSEKSMTELSAKFNNQNTAKSLIASITFDKDGEATPLINGEIGFYSTIGKEPILLGKVKTNGAGKAMFELPSDINNLKNDTGLMSFKALYDGDETYEATEVEFVGMDVVIELDFQLVDSVKTIMGTAYVLSKNGEKINLSGFEIAFYTPSLFGMLSIGAGYLEDGACTLNFPKKLPGDSVGNIEVYAKIIDNEIYGNIAYSKVCNWAKKHAKFIPQHRKLWTSDPPLWMIITLFILIFGVWSHYSFIFYKMWRIHKDGK